MAKTKGPKKNKPEVFKPLHLLEEEIAEFFEKFCNKPSFQDDKWFRDYRHCHLIDPKLCSDYYPSHLKSAHFKVTTNENIDGVDDESWIQLDAFKTHVNPESETLTCFIGSECYAMEWLPKPKINQANCSFENYDNIDDGINSNNITSSTEEYLVVASVGDGRGFDDYEVPNFIQKSDVHGMRKGLIQLWRFASNMLECVCCFANDHGLIWSLEAPKGGTSYCSRKRRLSLVAAAFDDGFVRIYSIPFPEDLITSLTDNHHFSNHNKLPPIFHLQPVAVLEPPSSAHIVARCLSWSWCDQQNYLAVGYGDGMANYFNLSTTSSILVRNDDENNSLVIKPIKTWIAHGALVSAIQILPLPGSKSIITGGWDRNIKLWNVREARLMPLLLLHRSVVHCLTASVHLLGGFFISLDDAFLSSNQSVVTFKQIYEEGQRSSIENRSLYTIPFETSNVYSLSLSLFFNSILVSDNSGNSILQNNFRAKHEKTTRRKLSDLLPIFTSQLQQRVSQKLNDESAIRDEISSENSTEAQVSGLNTKGGKKQAKAPAKINKNSNSYLIDKNVNRVRSYEEMISQYGIIFNDYSVNRMDSRLISIVSKFREGSNLKRARLTDYPITSINKCIWSPNKESSNTLANLIHSGFIRISSISKSFLEDPSAKKEMSTVSRETTRSKRTLLS
ncbi:uncharacterized protein LOC107361971 [Tetranychus urticae]|uniref:Uncharacterized protein n=1 Tax=Tetranychus urticae TaxID=32264 RepID=T1K856_TETUR|nr:uncharacterized protein LOC107361971 [Tetranychus urticae]